MSFPVLTRAEILKAIEKNEIKISPFDPAAVGPASVDLSLSNEFRRFQPSDKVIRVTNDIDFKDHTTKVVLKEGEEFLLKPGELVLGITREQIGLSSQICGLLEGRSRFARMGVYVHVSCCFMNPGIDNRQVLEIYNCSQQVLSLVPGTKICQFIFMRTIGEATYQGKFNGQEL